MDYLLILIALLASIYLSFNFSMIIAIILSGASLFFHFILAEPSSFSYNILIEKFFPPVTIFLTGYFTSFIMAKKKNEISVLTDEVVNLRFTIKDISEKFKKIEEAKITLEKRILRDEDFSLKLHDAISNLAKLNAEEIKSELLKITHEFIKAKKLAYYDFDNHRFIVKVNFPTRLDYVNIIDNLNPLYETLLESNNILTIKDELAGNSENILMAGVLRKKDNSIIGAILIFDIDFVDLNFLNVNLFKMICNWGAIEIEKTIQLTIYQAEFIKFSGTEIFNFIYFSQIVNGEYYKVKRFGIDLSIINIILKDSDKIIKEKFIQLIEDIGLKIKKMLRVCDYIFFNDVKHDRFILLLPHTDKEGANILCKKILEQFNEDKIYPYYNRKRELEIGFEIYYFNKETEEDIFSEFLISQAL